MNCWGFFYFFSRTVIYFRKPNICLKALMFLVGLYIIVVFIFCGRSPEILKVREFKSNSNSKLINICWNLFNFNQFVMNISLSLAVGCLSCFTGGWNLTETEHTSIYLPTYTHLQIIFSSTVIDKKQIKKKNSTNGQWIVPELALCLQMQINSTRYNIFFSSMILFSDIAKWG
jgi:hypothetical protein